jgi:hypothetical protein
MTPEEIHERHRLAALAICDTLGWDGTGRLECNAWAVTMLGSMVYAPWLYVYSAVAGGFREGWIPDNYYGEVVIPAIKPTGKKLSRKRSSGLTLFGGKYLPDIGFVRNGRAVGLDGKPASFRDIAPKDQIVAFKSDGSQQGNGFRLIGADLPSGLPDGVLQRFVSSHPDLARMCPGPVATVRLTTVLSKGAASIRSSYLRIGRDGETHVQSASHIRVPVDPDGLLSGQGFMPDWGPVSRHPETGFAFEEQFVPAFEALKLAAIEMQTKVPQVPCVGWDFTVDTDGTPVLLEWNGGHNDIKFSEAVHGPCFADMGWERLAA